MVDVGLRVHVIAGRRQHFCCAESVEVQVLSGCGSAQRLALGPPLNSCPWWGVQGPKRLQAPHFVKIWTRIWRYKTITVLENVCISWWFLTNATNLGMRKRTFFFRWPFFFGGGIYVTLWLHPAATALCDCIFSVRYVTLEPDCSKLILSANYQGGDLQATTSGKMCMLTLHTPQLYQPFGDNWQHCC